MAADSTRFPHVVRMLTAHVEGDRLLLRGQFEGGGSIDRATAPGDLVLRERGTGDELRIPLAPEGKGAGVVGAVEVEDLVDGAEASVWKLSAAVRDRSGATRACDVVSSLDAARTPSAIVHRDDGLRRVRPRTSRKGGLTLAVERLAPHAEVQRVVVEDDAVVLEAALFGDPAPRPSASASLVASSRGRDDEVVAPASLDGPHVRARLPLHLLDTGSPDAELWDLYLRIEGQGTFRVAGLLDGVADKKRAVQYPARTLELSSGSRTLRPYFTASNGLSVTSKPVQPSSTEDPKAPDGRADRLRRSAALLLARFAVRVPTRRPIPAVQRGRPRVSILVMHGYGTGGTVRTVYNQAAYLARDHEVEILSQLREREEPFFRLPAGVTLTPLDDRTEAGRPGWPARLIAERLSRRPSLLVPEVESSFARCTLWTDVQLVRRLRRQRGGILMATRPSLNLLTAQLAAPGVLTVGQEHMNFPQHRPALAEVLHRAYRRLDAFTVLTNDDLADYSRVLAGSDTRLVRIPNAISPLTGGLADPASRVVVAAGRLTRQKGFDRLIPAFQQVVREHPDWRLRIYGAGPQRDRLRSLIRDRGLGGSVRLMGRVDGMGEELAKGSIYVLSSRFEGFPMVLLEAMSKGLALISYDCPRGPSDLITPGEDGLLVPEGDVDGLARALLELVEDGERRRRFATAAVRTASRYQPDVIGRQWEDLFDRLLAERAPSWWHQPAPR